jgi:hypothetical protein
MLMGVHLCSTRNQEREKIEMNEVIGKLKTVFIKQDLREKIKVDQMIESARKDWTVPAPRSC